MSRRRLRSATSRACAVAALVAVATTGCGNDGGDDGAGAPTGTYTVAIERASFAARQHLAERTEFVVRVRNAGAEAIPNLVVTVKGFTRHDRDPRLADPTRDLWLIDEPPPGGTTAVKDAWSAGRVEPGDRTTLRWLVTPLVAGTHRLRYAVEPALSGDARAQLAGGARPRGTKTVTVIAEPAPARVDPDTGAVRRGE